MPAVERLHEWPDACEMCRAMKWHRETAWIVAALIGGPVQVEWVCDTYCGLRLPGLAGTMPLEFSQMEG